MRPKPLIPTLIAIALKPPRGALMFRFDGRSNTGSLAAEATRDASGRERLNPVDYWGLPLNNER
jgi:hypothetical protein